jgi:protein MAK11
MPIVANPSGKSTIVLGSYEGVISGYSFDHGDNAFSQIFGYQAHLGSIKSISMAGRHLATGGTDEVIHLFDTTLLREKGGLSCHTSSVTALALTGSALISGSQDGTICVNEYKGHEWHTRLTINGHKEAVSSIAMHPSGRLALSSSPDGTLRMWDLMRGTCACVHTINNPSSTFRSHPNQTQMSPTGESFVMLFPSKIQIGRLDATVMTTFTASFSHVLMVSDSLLIAGDLTGKLSVLSLQDGEFSIVSTIDEGHTARVKGIALLPGDREGKTICSVCTDGRILVWKIAGEKLEKIGQAESGIGRVNCMDASK